MLDINYLENFTTEAIERLNTRGGNYRPLVEKIVQLNQVRKSNLARIEQCRSQKNQFTKSITYLIQTQKSKHQISSEIEIIKKEVAKLNAEIEIIHHELEAVQEELAIKNSYLPNLPALDCPQGRTDAENVEVSRHNSQLIKSKSSPSHWEIAQRLGWVSGELGSKLSGSRFLVYAGVGAEMIRVLADVLLKFHVQSGYVEYNVPLIVNSEAMANTGQIPKFEAEAYRVENQYLIPTSEIPLTNFVADNFLNYKDLPLNLTTFTPCFRQEAGAAGRDTKGMIRLHQFNKVELVKITHANQEKVEFNNLVHQVKSALELFELPFRIVNLCTGDLGFAANKTYDFEVWFPSQQKYREISSCSSCGDFQARNMQARYRDLEGRTRFVLTFNGSGVAIDRLLAAILENYWDGDKLVLPSILRPYFENREHLN